MIVELRSLCGTTPWPISHLHVSPVGVCPNQMGVGGSLSYPLGEGISDYIDPDIKSAFRLLPSNPGDFDLLEFQLEGQYYIGKCLPMGCSISCNAFEKVSTFLHWLIHRETGLDTLDQYLDYLIFASKKGSSRCQQLMDCF